MSSTTPAPKREYSTPTLTEYGDVAQITRNVNKFLGDQDGHPGNSMNKTH